MRPMRANKQANAVIAHQYISPLLARQAYTYLKDVVAQGRVVRKLFNVNPGLNVNSSISVSLFKNVFHL